MFDAEKFMAAQFSRRTAEIPVPELAEFFDEKKAVMTVQNLTGSEFGRVLEETKGNRLEDVQSLLRTAGSGDPEAVVKAVERYAEAFKTKLPNDVVMRTHMIVMGLVEPKLDLEGVIRLREQCPDVFYRLSNKIQALTGQGAEIAGE